MSDIHFACPKCNQLIDVPAELANQLMECPTCRETIEVPLRTRTQPLSIPIPAVSQPAHQADESIFFQSGNIMVTNARFVVGAKTFAMRGITSVEVVETDEAAAKHPGKTWPEIIILLGLAITVFFGLLFWILNDFDYWILVGAGIICILVIIAGSFLNIQMKRAFKIVLRTAGGEVTAYQSFDRNHISQIVQALNNSIISHG
jgi:Family of unknown function (DUF6232)